jgi:hypothetical protein
MPLDTSIPVTGKDFRITLALDGALIEIQDAVVSFEAEAQYETVETAHLGTTQKNIDSVITGWRVQIEVSMKTKEVDEFLDSVHSAGVLRVPVVISAQENVSYRDGTSKRYTYINLKLTGSPKSARRADAATHRLTFLTGDDRIAG